MPNNPSRILSAFRVPIIILVGLIVYIWMFFILREELFSLVLAYGLIGLGSFGLIKETFEELRIKQFALDYIAILAIIVALVTQEYLVGIVIALMLATGRTLEAYGAASAKRTLTALVDRIPHDVVVIKNKVHSTLPLAHVRVGMKVLVRKGEVVPVDGTLSSKQALIDESSLTGEAYPVDKQHADVLHSGTVNLGESIELIVSHEAKDATYQKIVAMVEKAASEKAPLVRLADKWSVVFTVVTLCIAAIAYMIHRDLESILAVLVVATPCPLILATPIALLGGVNAAATQRIIVKNLASLEVLSRIGHLVFDKTGTITLGKPAVTVFETNKATDIPHLLAAALAIERNSLHPLAKAIVRYASDRNAKRLTTSHISEVIGKGISGKVSGVPYRLEKLSDTHTQGRMAIGIYEDSVLKGTFYFKDELKTESLETLAALIRDNLSLTLLTGDKKTVADALVKELTVPMSVVAEQEPEQKAAYIRLLQQSSSGAVAMVRDGINDAGALATADVGMVFSNEEQTAASEAADIVFLNGTLSQVASALDIAKRTIRIATQSIVWGIGLSVGCMILAAMGYIPPIIGAGIQEAIDVAVILNALRAARA